MDDNTVYKCDYFEVTKEIIADRKTPIYHIWDRYGIEIAVIKWYGAWRKFCLFTNSEIVWDNKCLTIVVQLLDKFNEEWKLGETG